MADAIDAHLAAGHLDGVRRLVDWLTDCPLPSRWSKATAAGGRGALLARHGAIELAETSLAEAVDLLRDVPIPLAQSRMLTAYGAVLTRRGCTERARPVLAEALQRADECGATWYAGPPRNYAAPAGGPTASCLANSAHRRERSLAWQATAAPTDRSPTSCSCRSTPSKPISPMRIASSASPVVGNSWTGIWTDGAVSGSNDGFGVAPTAREAACGDVSRAGLPAASGRADILHRDQTAGGVHVDTAARWTRGPAAAPAA